MFKTKLVSLYYSKNGWMSQIIRNEYRTIQAKNNMKYKGLIIQISIFSDHLK